MLPPSSSSVSELVVSNPTCTFLLEKDTKKRISSDNFLSAPLIADQYTRKKMALGTDPKTGERVIIDPAITFQRIYMMFYACINVGCLSLLATPFMEMYTGFWTAYVMCFCMFCIGIVVLVMSKKYYIVRPPQGSVITDAFKAIGLMIIARDTNAAKPSWRAAHGKTKPVPWNDHFIEELKRALRACKVFAFYPVFWVCYSQFSSNFVSQAGQMQGYGMPNDLMQNFDPISIIVFIPILDMVVYPILRKFKIELKPIARITIGFFFGAICLAYAAIVQHIIYSSGPCYGHPSDCPDKKNNVHIAVQTPAYVFIGLAEIFISGEFLPQYLISVLCEQPANMHSPSHRSRIRLHQSAPKHEILRAVPLPLHFRHRIRH
jgi:POT family proton-dependent oligopeptide transporter